jgi:exodeoxyribonuclease V
METTNLELLSLKELKLLHEKLISDLKKLHLSATGFPRLPGEAEDRWLKQAIPSLQKDIVRFTPKEGDELIQFIYGFDNGIDENLTKLSIDRLSLICSSLNLLPMGSLKRKKAYIDAIEQAGWKPQTKYSQTQWVYSNSQPSTVNPSPSDPAQVNAIELTTNPQPVIAVNPSPSDPAQVNAIELTTNPQPVIAVNPSPSDPAQVNAIELTTNPQPVIAVNPSPSDPAQVNAIELTTNLQPVIAVNLSPSDPAQVNVIELTTNLQPVIAVNPSPSDPAQVNAIESQRQTDPVTFPPLTPIESQRQTDPVTSPPLTAIESQPQPSDPQSLVASNFEQSDSDDNDYYSDLKTISAKEWCTQIKASIATPIPLQQKPQLNMEQLSIIQFLTTWFKGNRSKAISLSGPAGSGKTFLLSYLLKELKLRSVCFIAPTHKAKKLLKDSLEKNNIKGDCFTVAQALGKQPIVDGVTGRESFETIISPSFLEQFDLVVCDEASMVSTSDYNEILEKVDRIIWVGDSYQLSPINEYLSPCFSDDAIVVRLTKVMRYSGYLLKECDKLREGVEKKKIYSIIPDNEAIISVKKEEWLQLALGMFKSSQFFEDTSLARILAYRNNSVDFYNSTIKNLLYGEIKQFFLGQRLICCKPILRLNSARDGGLKWQIIANNSDEMTVISEPTELKISKSLLENAPTMCCALSGDILSFRCHTESGNEFNAVYLQPNALSSKNNILQQVVSSKNLSYKDRQSHFKFLNAWGDSFKDIFALTVHKSQGSTFKHVFLDLEDIIRPPSKKDSSSKDKDSDIPKLLYTSVSRASRAIFIFHD